MRGSNRGAPAGAVGRSRYRKARYRTKGRLEVGSSREPRLQQRPEFLDGIQIGLGRLLFRVRGVLPGEAERGGGLPAEPPEILLLGLQDLFAVPVVAEEDDAGFELLQLGYRWFPQRGDLGCR